MLLYEFLQAENIKTSLKARERNSAIRELMDLLAAKISKSDVLYQAVLDREKVMTTGIGNGVAIPHCKSPVCPEFFIALGIAQDGIDFNAIDGKTVNLVFLLLGPDNAPNIHIKLLSRISRVMAKETIRQRCMQAASGREIHQIIGAAEKEIALT